MNKKISDKDKKDWQEFLESKEKLEIKDKDNLIEKNRSVSSSIDLHGQTLHSANSAINHFIHQAFERGINSINVITGKGSRSGNSNNPYQSIDLGILKYSVPYYIKNNIELMSLIKNINFKEVEDPALGYFTIDLKKKL